jgi:DNA-binding LytR/AlgR family response regulator
VIVVGAAVFAVSSGRPTARRLAAAAVFMGGGIASMHYIGMTALHASAHMHHAIPFVVASVVIAIATSGLALWLAGEGGGRWPLLLSATVLGIAISGMHYTAMTGLTLFPRANPPLNAPALSIDLLAIVVAVVAFLICATFLLLMVPDRSAQPAGEVASPVPQSAQAEIQAASAEVRANDWSLSGNGADLGSGTYAPLGGAGTPRRRVARHLPVERGGEAQFVAVDEIVAVHANAHYTYLFNGTSELFCPLSIGEIESRLDSSRFVRVHRSHLVAIDRIVGLRRAGDNGVIDLAGVDHYTVPVSRSRFGWLKARLEQKRDASVA